MKTFNKTILLLALTASALLAAGCSGGAASSTNATSTANQPAVNPTAEPTADLTKTANELATSIAVIQNPATPAPAAPTEPVVTNLPDPCTLVTQAEVNAATGEKFDAGKSSALPPGMLGATGTPLNCSYTTGDKQVSVLIYQGTNPYTTQKDLSNFQKTLQVVSGLGDAAFWDTASDSLWVMKGNVGLTLEFDRMNNVSIDMGKLLMQKALSRVP